MKEIVHITRRNDRAAFTKSCVESQSNPLTPGQLSVIFAIEKNDFVERVDASLFTVAAQSYDNIQLVLAFNDCDAQVVRDIELIAGKQPWSAGTRIEVCRFVANGPHELAISLADIASRSATGQYVTFVVQNRLVHSQQFSKAVKKLNLSASASIVDQIDAQLRVFDRHKQRDLKIENLAIGSPPKTILSKELASRNLIKHEETNDQLDFTPEPRDGLQNVDSTSSHTLHSLILECQSLKEEIYQIHKVLRSLTPGFSAMSALAGKLPKRKLKPLLSELYGTLWIRSIAAPMATLFAWMFFRIRLPGLFALITEGQCTDYFAPKHPTTNPQVSAAIREIAASGLFDVHYYLSQMPEAKEHPLGPIGHYVLEGGEVNPCRLFDAEHYLSANPTICCKPGEPPLLHYIRSCGVQAYSPHPLFDARYYVEKNNLHSQAHQINPLRHFLTEGWLRNFDPHPLFSVLFYLDTYAQVRKSKLSPLEHFLFWGHTGKYCPNPIFDSAYYIKQCPEIGMMHINPLVHYVQIGHRLKLKPHPLFDVDYYLGQLPRNEICEELPLAHFLHSKIGRQTSSHPLFDFDLYCRQAPYIVDSNLHALCHFLDHGDKAGLHPNRLFHTRWYKERHPEFLKNDANALIHYLGINAKDFEAPHPLFDAQSYAQEAQEILISGQNPLVHYLSKETDFNIPICTEPLLECADGARIYPRTQLDEAFEKLMQLADQPFTHLFVMPGLVRGGAERAACNYIQYLQERHGTENVLILFTFYEQSTCWDWLPPNSRIIEIAKLTSLPFDDTGLLVTALILKKRPTATHVVNSYSFLHALGQYREVLQPASRYVVYLFGYDAYLSSGPASLTRHPYKSACKWVDCVITDSQRMRDMTVRILKMRNGPEYTTECCYNSALTLEKLIEANNGDQMRTNEKILWASRLVKSKRPDILIEIAKRLPNREFLVYGSAETGQEEDTELYLREFAQLENIEYFDSFEGFDSLDLSNVGVFVYTTESDGIPIVVLEAAAARLPIVAPSVGGIPELLNAENSWVIQNHQDIDAYVQAIEFALSNPSVAENRGKIAQDLVKQRHSLAASRKQLDSLAEFF